MKPLLTILLLAAVACNNKAEKETATTDTTAANVVESPVLNRSLVGKWRPVRVDIAEMSEEEKKDLIDHSVIEMTSTGEISSTMKDQTRTGTYLHSEQDSKLHVKLGEKNETFNISWDGDMLRMQSEKGTVTLKRQ